MPKDRKQKYQSPHSSFQSENSEELGEKLACLLEDKQLRQELSLQSYQEFCDSFDISIGVEKYSQLYDELTLSK